MPTQPASTHPDRRPFGCILNPGANRNRATRNAEIVRTFLDAHFPGSRMFISAGKGDISALAMEISRSYGRILICGGDGSINETVQTAMYTGAEVGIIPMGSGNDFVKTPGISRDVNIALKQLLGATCIRTDVLQYKAITEHGTSQGIVVNTLGLGFDGRANAEATRMRSLKGPLMYAVAALKAGFASRPVPAKITVAENGRQRSYEGSILMLALANGRVEGGNFRICPEADITDGLFNTVMVPEIGRLTLFTRLPLFLVGLQHLTQIISYGTATQLHIQLETPLPMHVDGEQIGNEIASLTAEIRPGALHLLVPAGFAKMHNPGY